METWVKAQLDVLLPVLAVCSASDEERIAQACGETVDALRNRGLGSMLSYKRPMREMRNALRELAAGSASPNQYEIALLHLQLTEDERIAIGQSSNAKREDVLVNQSMINRPSEVIARMTGLVKSDEWQEIAAGLSIATGRRLSEVLRFAMFREKSLYSVLFSGQRKSETDEEYEIPTLVPGAVVVAAWQRLRRLRDFESVDSDKISSSFGEPVKDVVVRTFSDLIESPEGRAQLYTHALRAVYPRLCIYYLLPKHVSQIAYAAEILGHIATRNGELVANVNSTLYYMGYKIIGEDGAVDGREGIWLSEPGVEVLEKFKPTEERKRTMMAETTAAEAGRTKISVDRINKASFDEQQQAMKCATANEAMSKLLEHNAIYLLLEALVTDVPALVAIMEEANTIRLEDETTLDTLRAAVSDKRRFRANYAQRSANLAERDYQTMSFEELSKQRSPEASQERWRRAVNDIIAWNDKASIPELRMYINAASIKQAVGGRGTAIKKYLETRQEEIEAHHQRHKLKASLNYGRDNIRERLYPDAAEPVEDE